RGGFVDGDAFAVQAEGQVTTRRRKTCDPTTLEGAQPPAVGQLVQADAGAVVGQQRLSVRQEYSGIAEIPGGAVGRPRNCAAVRVENGDCAVEFAQRQTATVGAEDQRAHVVPPAVGWYAPLL